MELEDAKFGERAAFVHGKLQAAPPAGQALDAIGRQMGFTGQLRSISVILKVRETRLGPWLWSGSAGCDSDDIRGAQGGSVQPDTPGPVGWGIALGAHSTMQGQAEHGAEHSRRRLCCCSLRRATPCRG